MDRNCSRFKLNSVKGLALTKNVNKINLEMIWGKLESKKMFPETISPKISNTNPSFHVKQREKLTSYFLRVFFLLLTKPSFCQADWALGYHSMKCRQFPDIFYSMKFRQFPKILSLKSFGNSLANSYTQSL